MKNKLGADEMKNVPLGAVGVWTLSDKTDGRIAAADGRRTEV
jgi:hypothetical protein